MMFNRVQRSILSFFLAVPAALSCQGVASLAASSHSAVRLSLTREAEVAGLAAPSESRKLLSTALVDLNRDGTPDLVLGESTPAGGSIRIRMGNPEARSPHTLEAYQRLKVGNFQPDYFLLESLHYSLPVPPDFLVAGDFTGDLRDDLVVANRNEGSVFLLENDGQSGFRTAVGKGISGRPTVLAASEVNRRDGLTDLLVATEDENSPRLLVFESPSGAWWASPETLDLAEPAQDLLVLSWDDDAYLDIGVVGRSGLELIRGRDRRLSLGRQRRDLVGPAEVSRLETGAEALVFLAEDVAGDSRDEIVFVTEKGQIRYLSESEAGPLDLSRVSLPSSPQSVSAAGRRTSLVSARMLGGTRKDLALFVETDSRIRIVSQTETRPASLPGDWGVRELNLATSPRSLIPLRLNPDGLTDLVLVDPSGGLLRFVITVAGSTHDVNSVEDESDGDLSHPLCATAPCANGECSGPCTLRAALEQSKADGGGTITFSVGEVQLGRQDLPIMDVPVAIIGGPASPDVPSGPYIHATRGCPNLFDLRGNGSTVQSLIVGQAEHAVILGGNGNSMTGNWIGLDPDGNSTLACGPILVGGAENGVGGDGNTDGNLITSGICIGCSLPSPGFTPDPATATGNEIVGNWVGLGPSGDVGISNSGINVYTQRNTIRENAVAATSSLGAIRLGTTATDNTVQGNSLGTNASGSQLIGMESDGVLVEGSGNLIGGTVEGLGNVIAGSEFSTGITVRAFDAGGGNGNFIQGNLIGTDQEGKKDFGNGEDGIRVTPGPTDVVGNVIGGASQPGAAGSGGSDPGNVISGNGFNGIVLQGGVKQVTGTVIQGNFIGVQKGAFSQGSGGVVALPNDRAGVVVQSGSNLIGAVGDLGGANVISANGAGGIRSHDEAATAVVGNIIFDNEADNSGSGLGIDIGEFADGPTPNDSPDDDGIQNYPVLGFSDCSGAVCSSLAVTLESIPSTTFRLEFFENETCDPSGFGEGAAFLDSQVRTTDGSGFLMFSLPIEPVNTEVATVTATATRLAGDGSTPVRTSEFSACASVAEPGFILVNSAGDAPLMGCQANSTQCQTDAAACDTGGAAVFRNGAEEPECTLRAALQFAHQPGKPNEIHFDVPGGRIRPSTQLPQIESAVRLDATTQPDGGVIHLDGSQLTGCRPEEGGTFAGLGFRSGTTQPASRVRGFRLTCWNLGLEVGLKTGIEILENRFERNSTALLLFGGKSTVQGNRIVNNQLGIHIIEGVNQIGTLPAGSNSPPRSCLFPCNLIFGNEFAGIALLDPPSGFGRAQPNDNTIEGNFIGINASGQQAMPNGIGIQVSSLPAAQISYNVISGNGGLKESTGIWVKGDNSRGQAQIKSNLIGGSPRSQVIGIPNQGPGIRLDSAGNVVEFNTIAFNDAPGILNNSTQNKFSQNSIFDNQGPGIVSPQDQDPLIRLESVTAIPQTIPAGSSADLLLTVQAAVLGPAEVELFLNLACDPSGRGEGETFLGMMGPDDVTGLADAGYKIKKTFPLGDTAKDFVTATLTLGHDTLPFSNCKAIRRLDANGGVIDDLGTRLFFGAGVSLTSLATGSAPAPQTAPPGLLFFTELISFTVSPSTPVPAGAGSIVATLELPPGFTADSYYNYGPTPDNQDPHWYEFLFDGTTGAEILEDQILLHYVDGLRGDHDLEINGIIDTLGGPVLNGVDLYIPYNQTGADGFVGLALSNLAENQALGQVVAFETSGLRPLEIGEKSLLRLSPNSQDAFLSDQVAPEKQGEQDGWLQVTTSTDQIGSFFQFGNGGLTQLDGSVAIRETAEKIYFTRVFQGDTAFRGQPAETFLSLVNPSIGQVEVDLTLRPEGVLPSGSILLASRSIPAKGSIYESIADLFGTVNQIAGGQVEVQVTEGSGIIGFELVQLQNQETIIGLNAAIPSAATELFSAQLASATGIFTNVNLVNLSQESRTVTLDAITSEGAVASTVVRSLQPGEQMSADADVLFGFAQDSGAHLGVSPFVGSLRAVADGSGVMGDVIFGDSVGFDFAASLPLQTETFSKASFDQVANDLGFFTGLAFYNPNSQQAEITIRVINAAGEEVGQTVEMLGGGQRSSQTVAELVVDAAGQVGGSVRIEATREIIAQMIFGVLQPSGQIALFSAVPPTIIQ